MAAAQPSAILSVTRQMWQGIGVKLGLTKRAMGLFNVWQQKAVWHPVVVEDANAFQEDVEGRGMRRSRQRQIAEQKTGHRMQLLHINRFLIVIRMTASFSFK